ncbi:MAG: hypothetical protein ACKO23_03020 [Gemmataceae bacterium]
MDDSTLDTNRTDITPATEEIAWDGVRIMQRLRGRLQSLRLRLENSSGPMTRTRKPFPDLAGSVQMGGQTPVTRTPASVFPE